MTGKQIIIDGVDVSGCACYVNTGECTNENIYPDYCKACSNCTYKLEQQLKTKEQECEELKAEIKHYKQIAQYHGNLSVKYTNKSAKLKQTLAEIKEIAEPYKRNIDKICGHCRRYDVCHACCIDDINCYQYKKPTTPACDRYCELKEFEINNMANQVLQKISECEVGNE